jgi:hypothetical protein
MWCDPKTQGEHMILIFFRKVKKWQCSMTLGLTMQQSFLGQLP